MTCTEAVGESRHMKHKRTAVDFVRLVRTVVA